jgi:aspartyl-tRNA(Asn)/glutamyl-tRNA(Gln) amidotransferase subunit C
MTTISVSDVKKLARLSALSISDDQVPQLQAELNHILEYIDQLNEVDTTDVEPTYQVNGLSSVTRPDQVIDYGVSQSELLKNVPERQDKYIKVPRVIE